MRKILANIAALTLATSIYATPTYETFIDIVDPNPDVLLSHTGNPGSYYTYVYLHDITDNGFGPTTHKVLSADLSVTLVDDEAGDSQEFVKIHLDHLTVESFLEVIAGAYHFNVDIKMLQSDGQLQVKLTAVSGDFVFEKSELEVYTQVVPEPGTMALTGLGLLGLGFMARRRKV